MGILQAFGGAGRYRGCVLRNCKGDTSPGKVGGKRRGVCDFRRGGDELLCRQQTSSDTEQCRRWRVDLESVKIQHHHYAPHIHLILGKLSFFAVLNSKPSLQTVKSYTLNSIWKMSAFWKIIQLHYPPAWHRCSTNSVELCDSDEQDSKHVTGSRSRRHTQTYI